MASALLLNSPEEKTRRFRDRQAEVEEGGIKRAEARRERKRLFPRAEKSEEKDTTTKDEAGEMGQSRDSKEVLWGEEDKKRGGKGPPGRRGRTRAAIEGKGGKSFCGRSNNNSNNGILSFLTTLLFLHVIFDVV